MLKKMMGVAAALLLSTQLAVSDEATKGKLSIWLGYPETLDAFKLGQAEFKKTYPNVEVEILTFELREFEAKLAVSVPAGSGPDILALHTLSSRAITKAAISPTCRRIWRRTSTIRR
jgi:multiple sugar transport system substrate-binding protein